MLKKLGFICVLLCSSVVLAAGESSTQMSDLSVSGSNERPLGWVPFAAAGVSAVEFDKDLTGRDGIAGNLRVLGSYYSKDNPFVFDAGLGVDAADLNNESVTSGLIEGAARYRFTDSGKWHAGPVANFNVGNNTGTEYGSSAEDIATFVGAQLVRDFAAGDTTVIRGGLKAMTDVGIPNSVVNKFLAEVQVGSVGETKVTETHVVEEEPVVEEEEEIVITKEATTKRSKLPVSVYFDFEKATVTGEQRNNLDKVIAMLKNSDSKLDKVIVSASADERGSQEYNQMLSEKRAEYIKQELLAAGIETEIEAIGLGEVSGRPYSEKRKVDVEVIGAAELELIAKK